MIKIGLVGAGHLGKIHLRLLKEIPSIDIVGFYDTDSNCSRQVSKDFQIRAFDDYASLLSEVDAVDVVTPTPSHFDLASLAIKNEKHVFIEKPLVTTKEHVQMLKHLASVHKVCIQVGYVERFNPAYSTALPYIHKPLFIESHRISEFHIRGTDVPVVLDMMIHDIDIILQIVKSPVKRIQAGGVAVVSDWPDFANARLEFENGCVANITASRVALHKVRKTRIFQRDSYVSIDFLNKKVEVYNIAEPSPTKDPMAVIIGDPNGKQKQIHIERPYVPETNAIRNELEEFARAIKDNVKPSVSLEDGIVSMEVAFKILEQLNHNAKLYV
ncbi:MAG: Gfo/Idh/MocA family oxidoreductase [Flavobacteriales bacterium]|nr:Gfo/Idh/MocA family oxidoreductase [Flavobacteriales bacterium]MCZ2442704.1 Gfo/Idh/MocA family oxidoreductase [Flavobacteriales bacterium]